MLLYANFMKSIKIPDNRTGIKYDTYPLPVE